MTKEVPKRLKPSKTVFPDLTPDMTTAAAFAVIGLSCLDHMKLNVAPLVENRDGEGLHQMRVALRRFRSALLQFKTIAKTDEMKALKPDVKWLGSVLGPARDLDVFVHEIIEPVRDEAKGNRDMAALLKDFQVHRDDALGAAIEAAASDRYKRLEKKLYGWVHDGDWRAPETKSQRKFLKKPVIHFAAKALDKADRQVRKGGTKDVMGLSPTARHELRIMIKQLRYSAQFFASLGEDQALVKDYLRTLSDLQDGLGALNDRAVALGFLQAYLDGDHGVMKARAAKRVMAHHQGDHDAILRDIVGNCGKFRAYPPFWK